MVGFGRKKSNPTPFFGDAAGKVDGSSLLDGDGEPTTTGLNNNNYDKKAKRVVNPDSIHDDPTLVSAEPKKRSWFGFRKK
ncbi:Aste57867_9360 [Aphanomyces stellatus]|uniref:Aste57867_9360 protein n=1 Tax=Aphanomyces stellatus TaxID=120398 RepID=A0A485KN06_9STRA|nr:hypothetical protein As57867_009324 [Aphanomyces stellatus]VFT86241.1 Aste57867_9360 [Aphanomyces stellatus]